MSLEDLCESKPYCDAPFEMFYESGLYVGATNGHAVLLINKKHPRAADRAYPHADSVFYSVIKPINPLSRVGSCEAMEFYDWVELVTPRITRLCGRFVDRELVRRFLNEAPMPGAFNRVVISSYGERDQIHIQAPSWHLFVMTYTPEEGYTADDFPTDTSTSPPVQTAPSVASRHAQALAQLQGSPFLRDKHGNPINKWGEPIKARY